MRGGDLEGVREERVAGQDRHRLSEDTVAGGTPAAQIVVVERRQIVVDQRVGMDHLDGGGQRQDVGDAPAEHAAGRDRQDRPQPLAPGKQ